VLGKRSQQLSEIPSLVVSSLVVSAEEHLMLSHIEGSQPRKRGPIVRPTETLGGIDPAQHLAKRGRDSRRIPDHVTASQPWSARRQARLYDRTLCTS
jgi:hypothetical protein